MTLVDKLHSLLVRHWEHARSQSNQGTVHLIEDHLKRLDGADEAEVHKVLGELYAALNTPTPEAPAEKPASSTAKTPAKKTAAAAQTSKA